MDSEIVYNFEITFMQGMNRATAVHMGESSSVNPARLPETQLLIQYMNGKGFKCIGSINRKILFQKKEEKQNE